MKRAPVVDPHFLEYRATILVCVASAVLSARWFQGVDLSALTVTYETWPREPWRLLTACLLHVNFMHLAFDLYWVWRLGRIVEPIFGLVPTIGIYVLLGAGSSAAQWAFSDAGVGLSGVGYGLFGLLWAMSRFAPSFRSVMDRGTVVMFGVWFAVCIATTVSGVLPVGNVAHGAGAVLGGLLGLGVSPLAKFRRIGSAGLVAALLLIAVAVTVGRPYVNLSSRHAWELAYDGYKALAADEPARAARLLEAAVERDPEQPEAWHNLGVAYHRLGRFEEASRALEREKAVRRVLSGGARE